MSKHNRETQERKMTVFQFLETYPQKQTTAELVKALYNKKVFTREEWNREIKTLLSRKIK